MSSPINQVLGRWQLPPWLAIGLLVVATAIAYANAWPDVLVNDDKYFVGMPRPADWGDIPRFFTEDLWAGTGEVSGLYRPLLLLSFWADSRIHGDWLAGYHLDNILLHLLVTLTVYGFLRQVPRTAAEHGPSSDLFALLAALVFAVHPVHTEVVDSIFNRSEMLVALAGAGGLWWFLYFLDTRPVLSWSGLSLCYLAALFSKESGIVLPLIAVALVLIVAPGPWTGRLRKCLPVFSLLLPLALYLVLRAHALANPGPEEAEIVMPAAQSSTQTSIAAQTTAQTSDQVSDPVSAETPAQTSVAARTFTEMLDQTSTMVGEAQLPTFRTVSQAFGAWGQSLWLMVWPDPLLLYRDKPTFFQQWISIAAQLVLLVTAFLQARARRYGLCAGLVFFYLALVPSSRLVGIGGMSSDLAERYLYFPSVGLAISLASGFRYLALRRGPWLSVVGAVTALALLTPLTWNRNYDWANEVRLFESEYLNGSQGRQTLRLLTAAYLREGMPDRAAEICDTKSAEQKFNKKYASHCAIAYMQTGRNEDAERAFLKAASGRSAEPAMHTNLAVFYLRLGRRQEAIDQFELAIQAEDNPALQAYRRGEMLVLLYPRNRQKLLEARSHFRQAVQLQPRLAPAQEWLDRLNRKLGPRRKS